MDALLDADAVEEDVRPNDALHVPADERPLPLGEDGKRLKPILRDLERILCHRRVLAVSEVEDDRKLARRLRTVPREKGERPLAFGRGIDREHALLRKAVLLWCKEKPLQGSRLPLPDLRPRVEAGDGVGVMVEFLEVDYAVLARLLSKHRHATADRRESRRAHPGRPL